MSEYNDCWIMQPLFQVVDYKAHLTNQLPYTLLYRHAIQITFKDPLFIKSFCQHISTRADTLVVSVL